MVNTRSGDQIRDMEDNSVFTLIRQILATDLEKQTKVFVEEISDLQKEMQAIKETNIELIKLLSNSNTGHFSKDITEKCTKLDSSFTSNSSGNTVIEQNDFSSKEDSTQ
ncbi:hypothetical protein JTB14_008878 [Gonioctena quinquepunctata]|nr:hypothetical protein JTB14_008878 [Gonioctena quinquepunctata]